jgi:hypothetical protein
MPYAEDGTMTRKPETAERVEPLHLQDLFTRYMSEQTQAHREGLGFAEPTDEMLPYEAVPVQPVDPRLAWEDALASSRLLQPGVAFKTPPDWSALVQGQEPAVALAFGLGNFPQLVRNLQPLLSGGDLTALRSLPVRSAVPAPLLAWAHQQQEPARRLLAAAVLRLAGDFDGAAAHLQATFPPEWQTLVANEEATLAWHRGDGARAAERWAAQPDSAPVWFNRGMAALFLGRTAQAIAPLTRAAEALPETSAWHHLARLYLALATARV